MVSDMNIPRALGYRFSPPAYDNAPGGERLEMLICRDAPDVWAGLEQARMMVVSKDGLPEELTLYHPWTFMRQYRVCPGKITLIDRREDQFTVFTFGGHLEIYPEAEQTAIAPTLSSTLPVQ